MLILLWVSLFIISASSLEPRKLYIELGHDLLVPCRIEHTTQETVFWWRESKDSSNIIYSHWRGKTNVYYLDEYSVSMDPDNWYNLTVKARQFEESTIFRCGKYDSTGENIITYEVVDVTVYAPFYKKEYLSVKLGERVVLPCYFDQKSDVVYWYQEYLKPDEPHNREVFYNWNSEYRISHGFDTLSDGIFRQSLVIKSATPNYQPFNNNYRCLKHDLKRDIQITYAVVEVHVKATGSLHTKANYFAKIGENITLTCHPNTNSPEQVLEWVKVIGENYEVLYAYQNSTGEVIYPNIHLVQNNKFWHNLTIKRVTTRDAGIYICSQTRPTPYLTEAVLDVNGSVELKNMVVLYDSPLELTYITDLKGEDSAQWTYVYIDRSHISTIHHIYYATSSGGGLLSSTMRNISKAGLGHGVLIDASNVNTVGKYKYFLLNPPEVTQREFWVIGTEGLQCHPENAVLAGKSHSHNCSAVIGFGNVIPVFRWTKGNESVEGRLIIDPAYTGYGRRWIYIHEFIAEEDDANATFTCKLIFKYDGQPSSVEDTSDPDYTESCNISYRCIEFPVRNTTITPNSEDVFAIRVGQNLTCSAIGYPEVQYMWTCVGYPSVSGQNYTISKLMTEKDIHECTCFAENTLSDQKTHFQRISVHFFATFASGIHKLPKDVVVRFGESAKLECTAVDFGNYTNSWRVLWAAEFDNDPGTSSIIYYSNGVMNTWQDDFEEGIFKHDLIIKYARNSLVGTYFCMDLNTFDTNHWQAEVVVTTSLKCSGPKSNVRPGEIMTLSCQFEYAGNLKPNMQWFHGGKLLKNGKERESKKEETIVMDHQLQVVAEENREYRCRVSFRSHSKEIYKDECVATVEV